MTIFVILEVSIGFRALKVHCLLLLVYLSDSG